ncbi:hypothetical protein [Mycolicibacterium sp. CBMA 361]|uniref:hypothetical protein n=1 Tax=Mycolicibacterium sp. CBMA 361 TaxID=2606610 RepID=UPI0013969F41|nr:hypothetical protein [Mycolicibacterium sp. CBMA 361]
MPGPLFVVGAVAMCPHGGQITTISSDTRVLAGGMPVALMTDQFMVAGCAFVVGTVPQPCLKVQWTTPTALTLINGQPAITQASVGLRHSPAVRRPWPHRPDANRSTPAGPHRSRRTHRAR